MAEKLQTWANGLGELKKIWKWLSETYDLTFSPKKSPLFSPLLGSVQVDFQNQGEDMQ